MCEQVKQRACVCGILGGGHFPWAVLVAVGRGPDGD